MDCLTEMKDRHENHIISHSLMLLIGKKRGERRLISVKLPICLPFQFGISHYSNNDNNYYYY